MTNDSSKPGSMTLAEVQGQLIRQSQLDRMVCFHLSVGDLDWSIRAKHIRGFQRNSENKIKVIVVTDMMTPQGPACFEVNEAYDWCIEMYTAALEGRVPSILRNPQSRFSGGQVIS